MRESKASESFEVWISGGQEGKGFELSKTVQIQISLYLMVGNKEGYFSNGFFLLHYHLVRQEDRWSEIEEEQRMIQISTVEQKQRADQGEPVGKLRILMMNCQCPYSFENFSIEESSCIFFPGLAWSRIWGYSERGVRLVQGVQRTKCFSEVMEVMQYSSTTSVNDLRLCLLFL